MTIVYIALNKLIPAKENVRKTDADDSIGELVELIAAHGLLQSLIVRKAPRGKFAVVGGQRRHMALTMLAEQGRLPADYQVACNTMADNDNAVELSLAENTIREAMHPADEFEAWRDLIDKRNMKIPDIAARFGVSERIVTQRMKLGRVAPALLDLYRQGKMDLEQVMAFTLTDDHELQVKIWNEGNGRSAASIRRALTQNEVPATDKRVRFVTLEAYEAAGGIVRRDLFDGSNSGYVADTALLDRLAREKLAESAEAVMFEGWKWMEIHPELPHEERDGFNTARRECVDLSDTDAAENDSLYAEYEAIVDLCDEEGRDQTDDEQQRLDEIDAKREEIRLRRYVYSAEVKAYSGAVITLDYEGNPEILRGLIRQGDAPKGQGREPKAPKEKSPFSAALLTSLRDHKAVAVAAELSDHPHVALAMVTRDLALQAFYDDAYRSLDFLTRLSAHTITLPADSKATAHLAKGGAGKRMRLPADKGDLWAFLLRQSDKVLAQILARAVAATISTGRMDTLIDALGMDLRKWFTPTAENYFSRVGKATILSDLADMGEAAGRYATMKKAELAQAAAAVAARNPAWLPEPMRAMASGENEDRSSDSRAELAEAA